MTLTELRYVVAVAQERNFRRAAESCFVTQPALSLAIQKLEEELGVPIFERSKTDVTPTLLGQRLIAQAQRVLDEAARLKVLASEGADPLSGSIRLGMIYTIAPYLLPELVPALHPLAPQMPLEVEENLTANLELELRNGRLDAAILALPFDVPGVLSRPLYREPFMVVVPRGHEWANRASLHAEELSSQKVLLLASGHCFSNQVVEACPDLQRKGGEVLQGTSLETIRNMVASGLGITVLPCSAIGERYRSPLLVAIPFAPPVPTRQVVLVWRKRFVREKAIDALVQAVRSLAIPCLEPAAVA